MGALIRPIKSSDAGAWLALLKESVGDDYPDKGAYELSWIEGQIASESTETWVAEENGQAVASLTFLSPRTDKGGLVANIGTLFIGESAHHSGAGEALLMKAVQLAGERRKACVARVFASDNRLQILFEKLAFICAGFQPYKHVARVREGTLFYIRLLQTDGIGRITVSESLPQLHELAVAVLSRLGLSAPASLCDGGVGYPLKTEIQTHEATLEDFELWKKQAASANPPPEVSGSFTFGSGLLRAETPEERPRAIIAQRENEVVAGMAYQFDPIDRCVRIMDSFCRDHLSLGALFRTVTLLAEDRLAAVFLEVDVLAGAPRLLKCCEQLGFVPVAYFPAFYSTETGAIDIIKLVKLNMVYSAEAGAFTKDAAGMVEVVDHNFQDQKIGVAIINLLRGLSTFEGLGDGELRKIARLFTQKLFRPGEKIFSRGDGGNEAYVVMRGQIDIVIEEGAKPIASIANGQIFGEQAFLDGAARGALAVAAQPSILLVIQRSAFNSLTEREPHLGMVVIRNMAVELSNRLRRTNAAVNARR